MPESVLLGAQMYVCPDWLVQQLWAGEVHGDGDGKQALLGPRERMPAYSFLLILHKSCPGPGKVL